MKKSILTLLAIVFALNIFAQECHITVKVSNPEKQDIMVKIRNSITRVKFDSVTTQGELVQFTVDASTPFIAKVKATPNGGSSFIVEPGNVYVDLEKDSVSGTPLNDVWGKWNSEKIRRQAIYSAKLEQYDQLPETAIEERSKLKQELDALWEQYLIWSTQCFKANKHNYVSALIFENGSVDCGLKLSEVNEILQDAAPQVLEYPPIQKTLRRLEKKDATSVGRTYTDLELKDFKTGKRVKLSKYIKGKIALIDYWASWCRPCRAEIPNIANIYQKYGKDIVVISLNVWDKPDTQTKAIKDLNMNWIQLTDDTKNATTIYGIIGIPHIMLIGADGTILARDLLGEEIEKAVQEALKPSVSKP